MARQTRRRFAFGTAGAVAGALAGCLGTTSTGPDEEDGRRTAQASFFVVADFATQVAGEAMTVRNLVPAGQHGHGWEPGPDVQRDVHGADVFVYVGEGFQPWADDLVENVHDDESDVAIIEAWDGIDLLDASDDHETDAEHEDGEDSDDHGDGHDDHGDDEHDQDEHDDGEHDEEHDDHDDEHDHGAMDPHFWLDPHRATQSVETIARGLAEVDSGNDSAYRENADSFVARLDALDDAYAERLDGRTRDVVLVAGHNSFRYLGHRYGFHVAALTGLAPDATPTPRDVRRAQSVIDEHDVEYVLAPVFESDRAARQLVDETDATGVLPLTPVPGLTAEWADRGWGYVEVMENVNLPSLARALGAE